MDSSRLSGLALRGMLVLLIAGKGLLVATTGLQIDSTPKQGPRQMEHISHRTLYRLENADREGQYHALTDRGGKDTSRHMVNAVCFLPVGSTVWSYLLSVMIMGEGGVELAQIQHRS